MKKIEKIITSLILIVTLCMPTIMVMAEESNSPNVLISTKRIDNPDGSYSIENVYVSHRPSFYATTYGTDTFTKEKNDYSGLAGNGSLLVTYEVTGTFDWNSSTKKVKVYDVSGDVTYNQGGKIKNKKTTTSGNNTSKATGKYSFTRVINPGTGLENSTNYSISISCNYKGKDS